MEPKRTVYYTDPLNDDFAHTNIRAKDVGADFPFIHKSVLWNVLAQCVYYCIAVPIVFVISKIYLGLKYENRQVLRKLRRTGYFLYGNHTRMLDAFLPAMTAFPKKAYVVSNPDAVSLPFLQTLVTMLGVIPIPTKFSGMRQFLSSVNQRYQEGNVLAILHRDPSLFRHLLPLSGKAECPGGGHGDHVSETAWAVPPVSPPGHDRHPV